MATSTNSVDGVGTSNAPSSNTSMGTLFNNNNGNNNINNNHNSTESIHVPMVFDTMTFENRQAVGLRDMEKRIEADMKRKRKSWEKEVERMRQEFLHLYPVDKVWGSEELLNDPLVAKRRGSTDILDPKKMKTLFLDYPDVGRKFRIRFDVSGFDPASIQVASDGDRIIVRANKHEPANNTTELKKDKNEQDQSKNGYDNNSSNISNNGSDNNFPSEETTKPVSTTQLPNQKNSSQNQSNSNSTTTTSTTPRPSIDSKNMNNSISSLSTDTVVRAYERKIQKPKEVDPHKFKSYLTSDHILIVEAPLRGRSSYHDLRRASPASSTHHSAIGLSSSPARSRSPSNSPGQDTPSKENKIGVPTFREENGQRRLVLVVDLGGIFKPQDITVQVIKDNKIWIWAKHEEKTTERLTKSKFSKEYELGEKIETQTLTGTLTPDGKLMVGAYAKGHGGDSLTTSKSDEDKHSTSGVRPSVDGLKQTQSCVGLVGST